MDFYIRKGSDLPKLLMEVVMDGRYDYREFYEFLEGSTISFTMMDNNGTKVINCDKKNISIISKDNDETGCNRDFYIGYNFVKNSNNKINPGTYEGTFEIISPTGEKLITPVRERLYIHIF